MKKIFLSANAILLSFASFAGSGGPDAYGYTWKDSNEPGGPAYQWIDILPLSGTTQVKLLSDDNVRGPFPAGFNFHFYWYDVDLFWVGSNGYIGFSGFTSAQLAQPFPYIPSSTAPQDFIAALTSDLVFGAPGDSATCWYWTNAAKDTLVVSYLDVPFWNAAYPGFTGSNTFQIILSAADSSVTFQYKYQSGYPSSSPVPYMVIGIENNSGLVGLQHSSDFIPAASYAVKFYNPPSSSYVAQDVGVTWNDNPETGAGFLPAGGPSFNMTSEVKNFGNQYLVSYNVWSRVTDISSNILAQDWATTGLMAPSQTQVINMSVPFLPPGVGTYQYITETQLAGDMVSSNDSKTMELVVLDTSAAEVRLSYNPQGATGGIGLNWTGGNGGAGVYFIPPFYPCEITKLSYYIVSHTTNGFSAVVYDDDGFNASPYTILDSVYVQSNMVYASAWNTIVLDTPIVINSGGFYVGWYMNGDGTTLGQDNTPPFSNRTFEVLNGQWAVYRFREVEDLMINAVITKSTPDTTSGAGVKDFEGSVQEIRAYPNPAADKLLVAWNRPLLQAGELSIFSMQGKILRNLQCTGTQTLLDLKELPPGIYVLELKSAGQVRGRTRVAVCR